MRNVSLFFLTFMLLGMVTKAQTKHTIGEKFGGGVVFEVSADGLHGLISETKDQGICMLSEAKTLIAKPENHSEAGKAFTDWKVPAKDELNTLYKNKVSMDGFVSGLYLSSSLVNSNRACNFQDFSNGKQTYQQLNTKVNVRAIRAF